MNFPMYSIKIVRRILIVNMHMCSKTACFQVRSLISGAFRGGRTCTRAYALTHTRRQRNAVQLRRTGVKECRVDDFYNSRTSKHVIIIIQKLYKFIEIKMRDSARQYQIALRQRQIVRGYRQSDGQSQSPAPGSLDRTIKTSIQVDQNSSTKL